MSDTPTTAQDWYLAGVIFGWEAPQCTAQAPAPLDDQTLNSYLQGVQDGGVARLDFEDQKAAEEDNPPPVSYPTIGPVPGGSVPLDDYLKENREILEGLFHQHMPHVDLPEYEPWYPPLGGMTQQPVP
ncbi:hypothetical protein ACH41E_25555 [Streptomyces sp. NPDC020412]|uniref:hypothetical protein n=1 Tax=Streptomyces sp. NPDC020412 TaxID=3365073 RepID=UPI00378EBA71